MLSSQDANRAAALMVAQLGEVALPAAILRSQEAAERGALVDMFNWRRIAEAERTLLRLDA
jgi:hypothetical protein